MTQRFRRWLPEPRELHMALWLAAVLFSITSSYTLVKIARDALFLSRLPAQALPGVYLMVGILTLAVTWVFGRLTLRASPLKVLVTCAAFVASVLVGFALLFPTRLPWIPFAFYVWVNVYGLILTSQFWVFINTQTDPRQAKRIFGIVGGGGILGGLVAGIAAARFGSSIPLGALSISGAALLAAMAVSLLFAARKGRVERAAEQVDDAEATPPLLRVPYVRWLGLATFCSVVVTALIDYQFKVVVQAIHPDAPSLAAFFGRFFVAVNVAALLIQVVATRWILQRAGAVPASAVLPLGIAAGTAATLLAPGFWTVLATRLWDQVLRFSLNKATIELFYFPMSPGLRRRAKAIIEAGIERIGDAVAGILILAAAWFLDTRPITLSGVVAILAALWLVAWFNLRRGYVQELGRSLRRMNQGLRTTMVSLRERSVLKGLVRALESPYERVVLQAVDLLEEVAPALLRPRLPRLLDHPSAAVRERALELTDAQPTAEAVEAATQLVDDVDPAVRVRALCARGTRGDPEAIAALHQYLQWPEPELRATALCCIVSHTPDEAVVRRLLEPRLVSPAALERRLAAEALGARAATPALHELLVPLLADEDLDVRCSALRSLGRSRWGAGVPRLVGALGDSRTEAAARAGLLEIGESIVPVLESALLDPEGPLEVRRAIPRVLREIPIQASADALLRMRDRRDLKLVYRVLKAMNRIRAENAEVEFSSERVAEDLDHEVRDFLLAELHADAQGEPADDADRLLVRVLRERRDQAFNRLFRRLGLIYPMRSMLAAYFGVDSANPRVRGNAAEYVESALATEHRALVAPLLPDAPAEQRHELAETRYGLRPLSRRASMAELLESEDAWVRTCALYVAGRHREREMLGRIEASLGARDERVRETAGWARLALVGAGA